MSTKATVVESQLVRDALCREADEQEENVDEADGEEPVKLVLAPCKTLLADDVHKVELWHELAEEEHAGEGCEDHDEHLAGDGKGALQLVSLRCSG